MACNEKFAYIFCPHMQYQTNKLLFLYYKAHLAMLSIALMLYYAANTPFFCITPCSEFYSVI